MSGKGNSKQHLDKKISASDINHYLADQSQENYLLIQTILS